MGDEAMEEAEDDEHVARKRAAHLNAAEALKFVLQTVIQHAAAAKDDPASSTSGVLGGLCR